MDPLTIYSPETLLTGKVHGYEVLPPVPQVSSVPPSELGDPSSLYDFETMSNFSWDAMASDDLSVFSEEDWEDLESTYAHDTLDYELDQDLKLLPAVPQRTYAQALGG
jgi:hypothetical protein